MTALGTFRDLVGQAQRFDENYELAQMPAYRAVLTHIRNHPECREIFGRELLATLDTTGDPHLFMFCLCQLKWPEIEAKLQQKIDDSVDQKNMRPNFFYVHCNACLEDGYAFP